MPNEKLHDPTPGGPSSARDEDDESVGLPHESESEGMVAVAEITAAEISTDENPMGTVGKPFNWRAPFFVALVATAGVAVMYAALHLFVAAGHTFILIGLSLFLAVGIDPAVSWLVRRRVPRWLGVVVVLVVIIGCIAGFIAAAVPALVTQAEQFVTNAPKYLQQAQDKHTFIGQLNAKFHLQQKLESLLSSSTSAATSGIIGAGVAVFSAVADGLVVLVLTIYFLADMPRIRGLLYRLFPHSRRPRAILIGDDILAKVGGYVLGNLVISLIAGGLTFAWLIIFGVPYALLLSIMVAILDLVPVVGSTVAGVVVALVAMTVSFPLAVATVIFFIVYRLGEDYLLVPRIIGKAVDVPPLVTVVAVLIGSALLGILGALVAIPIAAAGLLLARELLFPRLDRS
ncbi:Predicted PurR-regulated permease PerM [Nakamurella panacisegetis]|uniref:Predicted PurR-regulated permease PerM n=1 Tax=Nakamurella panacisegetis TaxID=1090615 RepID=A0A1H0L158_9ACTN|nr:AI-2E family transporter [Nakamurella panacisegetis]SDO61763.1 Predicted PurR-regulated permease PerM [Nakamurella panacisegetis]